MLLVLNARYSSGPQANIIKEAESTFNTIGSFVLNVLSTGYGHGP